MPAPGGESLASIISRGRFLSVETVAAICSARFCPVSGQCIGGVVLLQVSHNSATQLARHTVKGTWFEATRFRATGMDVSRRQSCSYRAPVNCSGNVTRMAQPRGQGSLSRSGQEALYPMIPIDERQDRTNSGTKRSRSGSGNSPENWEDRMTRQRGRCTERTTNGSHMKKKGYGSIPLDLPPYHVHAGKNKDYEVSPHIYAETRTGT